MGNDSHAALNIASNQKLPLMPIMAWQLALQASLILWSTSIIVSPLYGDTWKMFGWFIAALSVAGLLYFAAWVLPNAKRKERYLEGQAQHGMFQQDLLVWETFHTHPGLLFILAFFSLLSGLALPCTFLTILSLLPSGGGSALIVSVFAASFMCIGIHTFGYLVAAEYVQRHILHQRRPSVGADLLTGMLHALPLILLMSLLWIVFALVAASSKEKKKRGLLGAIHGVIILLKYYTFVNLARVAIHEQRGLLSYREAARHLRRDAHDLFLLWFRKGMIILPPLSFTGLGLLGWSTAVPAWEDTLQATAVAIFGCLLLGTLILEQTAFLLHFIGKRVTSAQSPAVEPPLRTPQGHTLPPRP